jgi:hypothetical protein
MLRFIVLGEIPGTHLVMTFYWVLILAATIFVIGELTHALHKNKIAIKSLLKISLFNQRQAK